MSDEENCPVCFYPLNRYWVQNVCLREIRVRFLRTLLLYGDNFYYIVKVHFNGQLQSSRTRKGALNAMVC